MCRFLCVLCFSLFVLVLVGVAFFLSFNSFWGRFFVPGYSLRYFSCVNIILWYILGLLIDFITDDFMHLETVCCISSALLWHDWQISFAKKYFVPVL